MGLPASWSKKVDAAVLSSEPEVVSSLKEQKRQSVLVAGGIPGMGDAASKRFAEAR